MSLIILKNNVEVGINSIEVSYNWICDEHVIGAKREPGKLSYKDISLSLKKKYYCYEGTAQISVIYDVKIIKKLVRESCVICA